MSENENVKYGSAVVRLYARSDGGWAVAWREDGKNQRTTRATLERAREFGKRKARELDQASGAQWISPARQERLVMLERIAGGEVEAGEMILRMERAVRVLGSAEAIEAAAQYYMTHGPRAVARVTTLGEAITMLLREYDQGARITQNSMRNEWQGFAVGREDLPLLEVSREMLEEYFRGKNWSARTRRNAITRWATFFRRARELELWPRERALPTDAIKRQKEVDVAPEIFTVLHGKILLAAVQRECPRYLSYLLLAGWCGVRPSECVRLCWRDVDFAHAQLHLPAAAVGKTSRERWVPMHADLVAMLEPMRGESDERICLTRAREELSLLARKKLGIPWPADVLRHSYITYRLQVLGDIHRVAEEAGNSATIIRAHYRRPIPPGMGARWFGLLGNR